MNDASMQVVLQRCETYDRTVISALIDKIVAPLDVPKSGTSSSAEDGACFASAFRDGGQPLEFIELFDPLQTNGRARDAAGFHGMPTRNSSSA